MDAEIKISKQIIVDDFAEIKCDTIDNVNDYISLYFSAQRRSKFSLSNLKIIIFTDGNENCDML